VDDIAEMHIGYRIKTLRESAKLSQEKLAKLAHTSRETIASMEQGRRTNPTLETLQEIVAACGATMSDLFPGKGTRKFDNVEVGMEEHAELYRKLSVVFQKSEICGKVLRTTIDVAYKEVRKKG
jgi:transcriptional regulator with XRE-family HTH domain